MFSSLGLTHIMFVHFPIALFVVAAITEVIRLKFKDSLSEQISWWCLILGTLGSIAAVVTGMIRGLDFSVTSILSHHKFLGIATMILAIMTILINWGRKNKWLYLGSLLALMALVMATAHFGGMLVFPWLR